MLKTYQKQVLKSIDTFLEELNKNKKVVQALPDTLRNVVSYVSMTYDAQNGMYRHFTDRPVNGVGEIYPKVCLKVPTGGGKTMLAVETIRRFQEDFAEKKTGLVVWIVHREQIYNQTIKHLSDKTHIYRQLLDQVSGGKTIILEKGTRIRKQDIEENLCILMLMIQSTNRTNYEKLEVFKDSGGFTDFFPEDGRYDEHQALISKIPNLDIIEDTLFNKKIVKTSLGNLLRITKSLFIVDELHRMNTDNAKKTLNSFNPCFLIGLSATPTSGLNILHTVTGRELNDEGMIKLDLHLIPPQNGGGWREMISNVKNKRDSLESVAKAYEQNNGSYIRPIALIQVDRTGREQRGLQNLVHSEDVREYLQNECGVSADCIAVKSATLNEIKQENLLSKNSEIRYIITKDALSEGWDCSFAYVLGIIPNTHTNTGMTQLVGRILRQPYAKKTGVKEIDESYVFYQTGDTQEVLQKIKSGFNEEGLGDLFTGIVPNTANGLPQIPMRAVSIKSHIKREYANSLYLPQWVIAKEKRKLNYGIDILPKIDWKEIDVHTWVNEKLIPSIGTLGQVEELLVDIEGVTTTGEVVSNTKDIFDKTFITRRITDVIPNPFLAMEITKKLEKSFSKNLETLHKHNGFIASEFTKFLREYGKNAEQTIFQSMIDNKSMSLIVSSDDEIGFSLPQRDFVSSNAVNMYSKSLYEDVDILSMNSLESNVARLLEANPKVLWWTRNKASKKDWYSVQGWRKDKVRPDFIVARKNDQDKLEIVYVMESKGQHLIGNEDSEYKIGLFELINQNTSSIQKVSTLSFELNDKFQFEFIAQNEEEGAINRMFNQNI